MSDEKSDKKSDEKSDEKSDKSIWLAVSYSFYSLMSKVVQPTTATLAIVGISVLVFNNVWLSIQLRIKGVDLEPDPKLMMAGLVAILFAMSVAQSLLREEANDLDKLNDHNAKYFCAESIGDLFEIILMIGILYHLGLLSNLDRDSCLDWVYFYLLFAAWLLLSLIGDLIRNQIIHEQLFIGITDGLFAFLRFIAFIAAVAGASLLEGSPEKLALFFWVLMIAYLILFVLRTDDQITLITEGQSDTVKKNELDQAVDKKLKSLIEDPENAITKDRVNQAIDYKINKLTNDPKNAFTEDKVREICDRQKSETDPK